MFCVFTEKPVFVAMLFQCFRRLLSCNRWFSPLCDGFEDSECYSEYGVGDSAGGQDCGCRQVGCCLLPRRGFRPAVFRKLFHSVIKKVKLLWFLKYCLVLIINFLNFVFFDWEMGGLRRARSLHKIIRISFPALILVPNRY